MIFDVKNCGPMIPVDIFDANGLEWGNVVSCNTETGEVTCLKMDGDGKVIFDHDKGEAVKVTEKTAAPLKLVPRTEAGKAWLNKVMEMGAILSE